MQWPYIGYRKSRKYDVTNNGMVDFHPNFLYAFDKHIRTYYGRKVLNLFKNIVPIDTNRSVHPCRRNEETA